MRWSDFWRRCEKVFKIEQVVWSEVGVIVKGDDGSQVLQRPSRAWIDQLGDGLPVVRPLGADGDLPAGLELN
jgi:hypothetical protein